VPDLIRFGCFYTASLFLPASLQTIRAHLQSTFSHHVCDLPGGFSSQPPGHFPSPCVSLESPLKMLKSGCYCGFVQDNVGAVPFPGSLIEHVKVNVRAVETEALSDNIAAELVTEPPELLTATENEPPVVMAGVV
jgi:hypothetical protein